MEQFSKKINTKLSVLSTMSYFDLFDIALTEEEILEYLVFGEADYKKVDIYLRDSQLINEFNGFFFLKDNRQIHKNFFQKLENAKNYWKKVRRYQWLFSLCPFVKLVAVCNSLTINDVRENSDIDLLVVTKKGKLFAARFFMTLLTGIFGIRRHGKKIKSRFCLSFYVSEEKTKISDLAIKPYDIYLAFWLKTLQPISGDYKVYEKIMEENREFLDFYFKTEPIYKKRYFRNRNFIQEKIKKILEKLFGTENFIEKTRMKQLDRINKKFNKLEDKSGTIISDDILKFHDRDARDQIRIEWEEKVKDLT